MKAATPRLHPDVFNILEKHQNLLYLSTGPGEGTTTAVLGTAEGINRQLAPRQILLIDGNQDHPDLHNRLELPQSPGLKDYLNNIETDWKKCIHKSSEHIHLLPIGNNPIRRGMEESFDKFLKMMEDASLFYDHILLDASPLSSSKITLEYFKAFKEVVLVVECEKTRWEVSQNAKDVIEANNSRLTGIIMNKRKLYIPKWMYSLI